MLARILLFLELFRIAFLHGSGVLGVRWKSFDPAPARLVVFRSWLIIIIAVKQNQFWGFWRVTAQSNTEARGKMACCPCNRPHNMYNSWLASTSTTSGAGALLTGTPRHLTSTVLSAFLKHPNSSMRDGGTGLSSYWKISVTSMPRY